jgi:hypothetical protein
MKLVLEPHILENAFSKEGSVHERLAVELYELIKAANRYRNRNKMNNSSAKTALASMRIFISYKWIDRDWMRLIRSNLEKAGCDYWLDEERLLPGSKWRDEIDDEIRKATLFISIYSTYACVSDGVFRQELHKALEQQEEKGGSYIIPVFPEEVDIPQEFRDMNILYLSDPRWLENLKLLILDVSQRKSDLAAVAEQLSRPEICIDNSSKISLRYREIYVSNKRFENWHRQVERSGGFCRVKPNVNPALEEDLKAILEASEDKNGCREEGSEIYIRTVYGVRGGHLVSEGGVDGKCRQSHEWNNCPVGNILRSQREDFVFSANTALLRVQELKERIESQIKELQRAMKTMKK